MRIVQLANFYGPESGGIKVTIDRLRAGYRTAGVDTALIVPGPTEGDTTTNTGRVITLRSPILPGSGGTYRIAVDRGAILEALHTIGPDRVEVSDKLTMVAAAGWARRNGARSVLFSHERLDAILARRVPRWFPLRPSTERWNAWLAERFDTIICASEFAAAEFRKIGASHVVEVPLGVDTNTFRPMPTLAAPHPEIRLISVGRLSAEKRPELAVDALRTLTCWGIDASLTLIGTGPMLDDLRRRAHGLEVDFLGHLDDREAVAGRMAAADAAIAPCPGEAFGLAPLEAMACGTPAVVARGSGAAELVVPGAGIAVAPGPRAIARAVIELMEIPRSQRSTAARRRAQDFRWQRTIDSMLAVHGATRSRVA